jgi:DNA polymerase-3 subunit epsilon
MGLCLLPIMTSWLCKRAASNTALAFVIVAAISALTITWLKVLTLSADGFLFFLCWLLSLAISLPSSSPKDLLPVEKLSKDEQRMPIVKVVEPHPQDPNPLTTSLPSSLSKDLFPLEKLSTNKIKKPTGKVVEPLSRTANSRAVEPVKYEEQGVFFSVDIETASSVVDSICQIGVVKFTGRTSEMMLNTYVHPNIPNNDWNYFNTKVHGIDPTMVSGAPSLSEISAIAFRLLDGAIIVHHAGSEKRALTKIFRDNGCELSTTTKWIDTCNVARRIIDKADVENFKLGSLCDREGIVFSAHDAYEDARASGELLIQLMSANGKHLDYWAERKNQLAPNSAARKTYVAPRSPTLDQESIGRLVICISGFDANTRAQLRIACENRGHECSDTFSKKVSILIIASDKKQTGKYRKAFEAQTKGRKVLIVDADEYLAEL